jgi:hypothetical protein
MYPVVSEFGHKIFVTYEIAVVQLHCQYEDYIVSVVGLLMNMEQLAEWKFVKETKVLGEKLPQCHFVHYGPSMT